MYHKFVVINNHYSVNGMSTVVYHANVGGPEPFYDIRINIKNTSQPSLLYGERDYVYRCQQKIQSDLKFNKLIV